MARSARFWGIFAALCLLAFVSALDVSIIATALPTITADIGGASQYIWIANSFVVASRSLANWLTCWAIEDAGGREQGGWDEVADVYTRALDVVWWVSLGVGVVGMVAVVFERRLELRKELETEYGIEGASGSAVAESKSGVEANVSTGEVGVEVKVEGGKIEGW
ncbi:Putative MFS general substrate transporter [Aspergillus calidoustus]|uniref:Putative MFS general substrate transporter n=1 Tax=Aspergillus calidoustus TaxID=454130 RepID=A0A0U5CAY5_ASPCI|nr:Putative MFS general substrate transporter [Aspergillus calidoustus]